MIGWKDENRDVIQYAQPINEPTQQMEPSLACYELMLIRLYCRQEKLSSQRPAQVSIEQRGRPRWKKREEREGELKGSRPVCGYFLKRLSLKIKAKAPQNSSETVFYISLSVFVGSVLLWGVPAELNLVLWCWMQVLFFRHTVLVFSPNFVECGYTDLNLVVLTLNKFFETWKYCTGCVKALECIKGRIKKMFLWSKFFFINVESSNHPIPSLLCF